MWGNEKGDAKGALPGRAAAGPIFLMTVPPLFVLTQWYVIAHLEGAYSGLIQLFQTHGLSAFSVMMPPLADILAQWQIVFAYIAIELALMRLVPGKTIEGPVTPSGSKNIYKANGFQHFLVCLVLYAVGGYFEVFQPGLVYPRLGPILMFLCFFAYAFCFFLYLKGHYAPSSSDSGSTGNIIFDYYWGMELHPKLLGWDVKVFTNCRFGMMGWALLIVDYAFTQKNLYGSISDSMVVSVILQLIYIGKFFYWEVGYFYSMDIQHDRAGYYICWGCMVWVPSIYTGSTMFLVEHPVVLGLTQSLLITFAGILCIWINYDADRQRQNFRKTNGREKVWGRAPVIVHAKYVAGDGKPKESILLASGWWGLARHFHYLPEISASFFWSVPALFTHLEPYFYTLYLIVLLVDRAYRDDAKCRSKYGKYWEEYCAAVPDRIVPVEGLARFLNIRKE